MRILKSGARRNYLGDYLISAGVITQQQLKEALDYQKELQKEGKKELLGQILIDLGYCTVEDIMKAIAANAGVPFLSLEERAIDEKAVSLITPDVALRYQALPIGFDGDKLMVAMLHPMDIIAIDDISIMTGYDVQPVVIPDIQLKQAIDKFTGTDSGIVTHEDRRFYSQLNLSQTSNDNGINTAQEISTNQSDPSALDDADKPAVRLSNMILSRAVKANASDVHIEPYRSGMRVRFRIDGVLHEIMHPPKSIYPLLISRFKVMANMDIAERRIPQDGRFTTRIDGKIFDVRVASMPTSYGEKLTLRLLNRNAKLLNLSELGFPKSQLDRFHSIINLPYGFILITGPTGSGKSTTLYAVLTRINSSNKNVLTLEDPIERWIDGINQVQVNRKAGLTFASGLRAFLRNDPDVIMVGEIRDRETALIATESALTGHLVLSTLHTNDAASAITRLLDMGIEPYLIASALVGVVAQRLVRVLCPYCKEEYQIHRNELQNSVPDFPLEESSEIVSLYRAKSCSRCNKTGYIGRIGIYEVLYVSETIQKMILNKQSAKQIRQAAIEEGMMTMLEDGLLKVRKGITSLEEVLRVIV